MFSAETYAQRRNELRDRLDGGLALFLGNEESPMNYPDNTYSFRQDASFIYYFGHDEAGMAGVIDLDDGTETLFGDDPTVEQTIWVYPGPPMAEKATRVGVAGAAPSAQLAEVLKKARSQGRTVHFLPQYRAENVLKLRSLLDLTPEQIADGASESLIRAVVAGRSIKSDEEIVEIQKAVDICEEMQVAAMRLTRPGIREHDVCGAIEGIAVGHGGYLSFPTIFTIRGETLHNHYHGNVMQDGDIAINDSGAVTESRYAADITRTLPVGGRFDSRQKDVYRIVLDAQTAAIDACRPGVPFRDVHALACKRLALGLKEMGVMRGDVEEAVPAGAHALFFQCGLGHMMGLDVHDMEGLGEDYVGYTDSIRRNPMFGFRSLRLGRELEPGFVLTVEPGLYFIPRLIDQWRAEGKCEEFIDYDAAETFKDFGGVRLEDDVLITDDGHRVLSDRIPRSIEEVEATCAG